MEKINSILEKYRIKKFKGSLAALSMVPIILLSGCGSSNKEVKNIIPESNSNTIESSVDDVAKVPVYEEDTNVEVNESAEDGFDYIDENYTIGNKTYYYVRKNKEFGIIDKDTNEFVIPLGKYTSINPRFSLGMVKTVEVNIGKSVGYLDQNSLEEIIKPGFYDDIRPGYNLGNRKICYVSKGDYVGCIDAFTFEVIIEPIYDEINNLPGNEVELIKDNKKEIIIIDKSDNTINNKIATLNQYKNELLKSNSSNNSHLKC